MWRWVARCNATVLPRGSQKNKASQCQEIPTGTEQAQHKEVKPLKAKRYRRALWRWVECRGRPACLPKTANKKRKQKKLGFYPSGLRPPPLKQGRNIIAWTRQCRVRQNREQKKNQKTLPLAQEGQRGGALLATTMRNKQWCHLNLSVDFWVMRIFLS